MKIYNLEEAKKELKSDTDFTAFLFTVFLYNMDDSNTPIEEYQVAISSEKDSSPEFLIKSVIEILDAEVGCSSDEYFDSNDFEFESNKTFDDLI